MKITLKTIWRQIVNESYSRVLFSHLTSNKKFSPNKTIEKLLEIEIAKFGNFGDIFYNANNKIKKLESSSQKLNDLIKDPKNFIFETVSKIKRDVDLRREKLKAKIDEISNEMIYWLINFQQECYENIDKIKMEEKTKDFEINKLLYGNLKFLKYFSL